MLLGTLLEKVKAALKSPLCLYCDQKLQRTDRHFCQSCEDALGLRQPQAILDTPSLVCHSAVYFNPTVKKLLYGYKFYGQESREPQLAALLIDYWERVQSQLRLHPESVLVVPIPAHHYGKSRVEGFARRFARHFGYDFRPEALAWQRRVKPQHTLTEKQARFANIANGLQARKRSLRGYRAIIVIDDLTTTGATLHEASRALRHHLAQPHQVDILALAVAKVPLGSHP
jgi:predicted amidophosphoribosyltransferase